MSFPTQIWLIPHALILVLFSACGSSSVDDSISNTGYGNWSIEELADEVLAATMNRYPSMPTFYSIKNSRHDRLFDNSLKALTVWQVKEDEWLARLNALGEPQEIGSRDWVTYGILRESLEAARDTRICRKELWETSTTTAWYTSLPFIFDIQPLDSEELRNEALQRLAQVDNFIDTEIENLKLGLSQGYSSPRV
ncbi:MAG: DUF885 family protein, partial [Porticoccaceae bacterium]|nr:DUF885 family protein [Porticoccaceae bacterium]